MKLMRKFKNILIFYTLKSQYLFRTFIIQKAIPIKNIILTLLRKIVFG
jgi:hypothetical protein